MDISKDRYAEISIDICEPFLRLEPIVGDLPKNTYEEVILLCPECILAYERWMSITS